jgi:HEAT repeat protein
MESAVDYGKEKRTDPRSVEELVGIALTNMDEDAAWEAVTVLHYKGTREVLDGATRLCASPVGRERKLGADILGQLGVPDRTFPSESFDILANMLRSESDPAVLESIGVAFGHLRDGRAISLLLPFSSHPDSDVRFGVVLGLTGHDSPEAVAGLVQLSRDEDEHVRDWATFGLGTQTDADTPEIRDALFARTSDHDDDTRGEALVGLARRKDPRVIEPLTQELSSGCIGRLAVEAAESIGDPRLFPLLSKLRNIWATDDPDAQLLEDAIASCAPR